MAGVAEGCGDAAGGVPGPGAGRAAAPLHGRGRAAQTHPHVPPAAPRRRAVRPQPPASEQLARTTAYCGLMTAYQSLLSDCWYCLRSAIHLPFHQPSDSNDNVMKCAHLLAGKLAPYLPHFTSVTCVFADRR